MSGFHLDRQERRLLAQSIGALVLWAVISYGSLYWLIVGLYPHLTPCDQKPGPNHPGFFMPATMSQVAERDAAQTSLRRQSHNANRQCQPVQCVP